VGPVLSDSEFSMMGPFRRPGGTFYRKGVRVEQVHLAIVSVGIALDQEGSRVKGLLRKCRELLIVAYHPWPVSGRYCLPRDG
jgi:hypothetical protein